MGCKLTFTNPSEFLKNICICYYYFFSLNAYIGYVQLNALHIYYKSESFMQQLEITSLELEEKSCSVIFGLHFGACSGWEGRWEWFLCAGSEYEIAWQVQINLIFCVCDFTCCQSNFSEDDWSQQTECFFVCDQHKEWHKLLTSSSLNHITSF